MFFKRKRHEPTLEKNIPNLLMATGTDMFRHQKLIKDIDKLKIPEEELFFIYVGLTALGMYVTMKALETALNRLGYDAEITLTIYNRINSDTQEAVINNLIERWGNPEYIKVVHDNIILPLLNRIPEYFQEQIDWQESGANDLPPHKWGVFSIVLYQALGKQRGNEIIRQNLFESYADIKTQIEMMSIGLMQELPEIFEKHLRSPMGDDYRPDVQYRLI